jgi:hypothetical protein
MPKNPYYDAQKNSKGWALASIYFDEYTQSPKELFITLLDWCKDHNLKLMTDFNCREVGGRKSRFDFWFRNKEMAVLFKLSF